ncbi:MAG: response regulator [Halarchaeum sp.]
MALISCDRCGTTQNLSILRSDTACQVCGASGESLSPVADDDDGGGRADPATVLLADDDDDLRETFALWLASGDGWECVEATDGNETLRLLDGDVDVLVLDRRMPGLSGPEVVDRLDETAFAGSVLVVSAYEEDAHLDADDVDGYLTKPIRHQTFVGTLERLVD